MLFGITIESSIDYIIAAISIKRNIVLLHNDSDFNNIKKLFYLKTI